MAQLGNVFLDVVYSEKPERSVKTTDHPVEDGEPIVDHVEVQPYGLSISGVVTGSDAAQRLRKLEYYMENGVPVTYSHRNELYNCIIETFNSTHDGTVAGAFSFTMRLKRIRRALTTPIDDLDTPAYVQVKDVGNKGLQQAQKPTAIKNANGLTPAQAAAANGNHVKS